MEPIKINLNTKVGGYNSINVKNMTECNGELIIETLNNDVYFIKPGMKLYFFRNIYTNNSSHYTISESVDVLYVDDENKIHTTVIPPVKIPLYYGRNNVKVETWIEKGDNGEEITKTLHYITAKEPHNIFPQDLLTGEFEATLNGFNGDTLATFTKDYIKIPDEYYAYIVTSADCITYINRDDTCGKRYKKVETYRYDFCPQKISNVGIAVSGFSEYMCDFMSYMEISKNPFYYYYIERNDNGEPKELDYYGKPIKHCCLYTDPWWKVYDEKTKMREGRIYVNSGNSNSLLFYDAQYWSTNIFLHSSSNESLLGSYDNFSSKFVEDLEQSLIPAYIDMERIKYAPMIFDKNKNKNAYYKLISTNDDEYPIIYTKKWVNVENMEDGERVNAYILYNNEFKRINHEFYFDAYNVEGGRLYREKLDSDNTLLVYTYTPNNEVISSAFTIATSITFNLHFRKRDEVKRETDNSTQNGNFRQENNVKLVNTPLTSGNVYTDGWFINEDENLITWWNGFDYSGETFDSEKFEKFYDESGTTSDLIGCLNFTDNDIFYRKEKVSRSFLRFSFYTSNDPINQKLLYYSTTFLDSTTLYSKYLKQMMFMNENDLFNEKKNKNINLNAAVVFCSANTVSARVDTKIVLTNEYDKTKSSEGFNLYLFSDDKNLNLENAEKTIYMKVEFNHAGNGKTIPMIVWPKDENGNFTSLTMDNFIENLYIPVKLTYIDGKYIYYIPGAKNNENGNIELVLFEPKLDFIDDIS